MFVAVVYKEHIDTFPRSHKPEGDYSCFVAVSKEEAVEAAVLAAQRWQLQKKQGLDGKSPAKYYGPYEILIGELTESTKTIQYTVEKIEVPF